MVINRLGRVGNVMEGEKLINRYLLRYSYVEYVVLICSHTIRARKSEAISVLVLQFLMTSKRSLMSKRRRRCSA